MKAPTRKPTRTPPSPRASSGGSGTRTHTGSITAAAESYSAAMAKPDVDVNNLRGMDKCMSDFAGSLEVVTRGITAMRALLEEAMPDEGSLHEQVGLMAKQMARVATDAESVRLDQRRRNAADWVRIEEAPRKNERGYDFGANQEYL